MILMELSKAFDCMPHDCMPHDLLIAKLKLCGFCGLQDLRLIADYLSDRKQRVKVASTYSDWLKQILVFPRALYWDPSCSTFSSTTLSTI